MANSSPDFLRYGLIAGGVYLAWRSGLLDQFGLSFIPPSPGATATATPNGGGGSVPAPAPGSLPDSSLPSGGGGPVATPAPGPGLTAAQIDALTKKAAGGDVVAAAQATSLGIRYNGHQWNWFREQDGKPPSSTGTDAVMTASDYLKWRTDNGMTGVTGLAGIPFGNYVYGAA